MGCTSLKSITLPPMSPQRRIFGGMARRPCPTHSDPQLPALQWGGLIAPRWPYLIARGMAGRQAGSSRTLLTNEALLCLAAAHLPRPYLTCHWRFCSPPAARGFGHLWSVHDLGSAASLQPATGQATAGPGSSTRVHMRPHVPTRRPAAGHVESSRAPCAAPAHGQAHCPEHCVALVGPYLSLLLRPTARQSGLPTLFCCSPSALNAAISHQQPLSHTNSQCRKHHQPLQACALGLDCLWPCKASDAITP